MAEEKDSSIRGILERLNVGDVHVFPIKKLPSVKTACSMYGAMWGRYYRTSMDRPAHAVIVTRLE